MIVETGAGLPNADAYVDAAFCDGYHSDRGNSVWGPLTPDLKTQAIIRATQAVDGRFRQRFPGVRAYPVQALEWPRFGAFDISGRPILDPANLMPYSTRETSEFGAISGIPLALKFATAEAALVEAKEPGALAPALDRGGKVNTESVEPGLYTQYAPSAPVGKVYFAIIQALTPLLIEGGQVVF